MVSISDVPTGSYLTMLRGRLVRGLVMVRKKPVMAIDRSRTEMTRDFTAAVGC